MYMFFFLRTLSVTSVSFFLHFFQSVESFVFDFLTYRPTNLEILHTLSLLFPLDKEKFSFKISNNGMKITLTKVANDNINSIAKDIKNTHALHLRLVGNLCEKDRIYKYHDSLGRILETYKYTNNGNVLPSHDKLIPIDNLVSILKPLYSV